MRKGLHMLVISAVVVLLLAPAGTGYAWQEMAQEFWEWYREEAEDYGDPWFLVEDSPVSGGSISGIVAWASPIDDVDYGFDNIIVGWGSAPITYGIDVDPDTRYVIVLGFCEGWWGDDDIGVRVVDVWIEGVEKETIDIVETAGVKNRPFVKQYAVEDLDGDGWLRIDVIANEESSDQNSILNVVWVFEDDTSEEVDADVVITGELNSEAYAYIDCGGLMW